METFDSNLDTSDIIAWDGTRLLRAARILQNEVQLNPIPRQANAADKLLSRCAFEMWARRHRDAPEEVAIGTQVAV
jgi:hypothetical protein